jgi:hypothetical protein
MFYGDIEGKGKIYTSEGEFKLSRNETEKLCQEGVLFRGWVRYKLGWRTIMFKGTGKFYITTSRVVYLEPPEFINRIHTFNIDHEIGDFGGWDYHAHRMRRAVQLGAVLFFELPLLEITDMKHKKESCLIYAKDEKGKYKIVVDDNIGKKIEGVWMNVKV